MQSISAPGNEGTAAHRAAGPSSAEDSEEYAFALRAHMYCCLQAALLPLLRLTTFDALRWLAGSLGQTQSWTKLMTTRWCFHLGVQTFCADVSSSDQAVCAQASELYKVTSDQLSLLPFRELTAKVRRAASGLHRSCRLLCRPCCKPTKPCVKHEKLHALWQESDQLGRCTGLVRVYSISDVKTASQEAQLLSQVVEHELEALEQQPSR